MDESFPTRAGRGAGRRRAFTLLELLVVLAILLILSGLLLGTIVKARASARSALCASKLAAIGGGFRQYAIAHNWRLPDPYVSQTSWERLLLGYVPSQSVFRCEQDEELFQSLGSSYDWRDTGDLDTTLAGRLMTAANRPGVVLAFEALPGWHFRGKVNAAHLDGSVRTMGQDECFGDLMAPVVMERTN